MLELRVEVGARLKTARELRGLTRAHLATRASTDPDHIGRVERGVSWAGGALLVRLCRELEISADWALFGKGPGPEGRKPFEVIDGGVGGANVSKKSKVPDVVLGYIATEGHRHTPKVLEKLKRFDYGSLRATQLTLEHVRKLASLLDHGGDTADD